MREADHYVRAEGGRADCALCPHRCAIPPGGAGKCGARRNIGGALYAESYEEIARLEREPVERLPLYHWRPGTTALAVGGIGESFPADVLPPGRPPGTAVAAAETRFAAAHEIVDIAAGGGVGAIAYWGGEPLMWLEQCLEIAERARADGLANLVATNAFAEEAPARALARLTDAASVAILGPEGVYGRRAGAARDAVLRTVALFREAGAHVEASLVLIPGTNDDPASLEEVARLIEGPFGGAPLHVAGSVRAEDAVAPGKLLAAAGALRKRLPFVYVSNVASIEGSNTACRGCGALLVSRFGGPVATPGLAADGRCAKCGAENGFRVARPAGSP